MKTNLKNFPELLFCQCEVCMKQRKAIQDWKEAFVKELRERYAEDTKIKRKITSRLHQQGVRWELLFL